MMKAVELTPLASLASFVGIVHKLSTTVPASPHRRQVCVCVSSHSAEGATLACIVSPPLRPTHTTHTPVLDRAWQTPRCTGCRHAHESLYQATTHGMLHSRTRFAVSRKHTMNHHHHHHNGVCAPQIVSHLCAAASTAQPTLRGLLARFDAGSAATHRKVSSPPPPSSNAPFKSTAWTTLCSTCHALAKGGASPAQLQSGLVSVLSGATATPQSKAIAALARALVAFASLKACTSRTKADLGAACCALQVHRHTVQVLHQVAGLPRYASASLWAVRMRTCCGARLRLVLIRSHTPMPDASCCRSHACSKQCCYACAQQHHCRCHYRHRRPQAAAHLNSAYCTVVG